MVGEQEELWAWSRKRGGGARLQAESCSEQGGGPDKSKGQAREGFGGGSRLQ